MRSPILMTILATSVLFALGCNSSDRGGSSGGDSPFASRFDAAKAIQITNERDAALAKLAQDAGEAGDGDIVKKCVREIHITNTKDDAAYNAALKLAKAGNGPAATEVAKLITITTKRDAALSKIAKGEYQ